MTFLSCHEASRRLGIDAKTLRRWLAQAQLPLDTHPTDGRLKGVREEHLLLLAHTHHRRLSDLPEASCTMPAPGQSCPLPTALLTVPETLSALQAQLAALQQQVTDLTQLLLPPAPAVAPTPAAKRSTQPAPAAPEPARPAVPVLPRVEVSREGRYLVRSPKQGVLPLEPESPAWFGWLANQSAFRFVGKAGHFTAHREVERVPHAAWRAHRRMRNHTYNLRLGPSESLTIAVLEQAAATLQAHLS
jgi:hypothetical protein